MSRDIDDILHLTRDLLTTEAGHRHIERLIDSAGIVLQKAVGDLFSHPADTVDDRQESSGSSPDRTAKNDT
jgi:hypothetical protein